MYRSDVCAVVVTYNRAELLRECIEALLHQSVRPRILLVDNASTDGTADVLDAYASEVEVLRLEENLGGAGGFHAGMLRASGDRATEFFWILDDDTIPSATCLEELLLALERLDDAAGPPVFAASRVEWVDGRRHPMNQGMLDQRHDNAEAASRAGCVALRAASFVSVLVTREAVEEKGLPVADFFIWGDDVEFTLRLSADGLGVLVPNSVATHKTTYFSTGAPGARFYYRARNWLWLLRFAPSIRSERAVLLGRHLRSVAAVLVKHRSAVVWKAAFRGTVDGLLTRPDLSAVGRLQRD